MYVYVGLAFYADIGKLSEAELKIDYLALPLIVVCMTTDIVLLGLRFHRFLTILDIKMSIKKSILIYLTGLSLAVTPAGSQIIKSQMVIIFYMLWLPRNSMKTRVMAFAVVTVLTFSAASAGGIIALNGVSAFATQGEKFIAKLTGNDEVPPKDTKATGIFEADVSPDGRINNYVLNVTNMNNVTLAHIHEGGKGVNGPILLTLYKSENPKGKINGILSKGRIDSNLFEGPFAGKYNSDLMILINEGAAYVNVHTKQNPQGEIRGQLSNASDMIS